jgi:protein-tyrosine phosphatase
MRRIEPFSLWIGNVGDLRDPTKLYDAQIRAVVDLAANEPFPNLPRDLIYCRVPLIDGSGNDPALLRLAVRTLAQLLAAEVPTIVCCSNGMSRAPSIAAGALHIARGMSLHDALTAVTPAGHDVSPGLWREVELICSSADQAEPM